MIRRPPRSTRVRSSAASDVYKRQAHVLPSPSQATRNLSFLEVSAAPSRCCFSLLFHWTGAGWFEFPTEWKPCKRVRARGGGACACMAHGMQCLRDGRACCPVLPKQLVICRSGVFHRRRHVVVSTRCFTGLVRVGLKFPQNGNRANVYAHVLVCHKHVWRTLCSVCKTGARVAQSFPSNL